MDGPPPGGRNHPRTGRINRRSRRHPCRRDPPPALGRTARRPASAAVRYRSLGREVDKRPPSVLRPDEHARSRDQDHSPAPHQGRRQVLRNRRPLRLRRRPRTRDPTLRLLDPRRTSLPTRKQDLQTCFFLSAFTALRDPASRTYYDLKIAQDKRHNHALITLTRQGCDVMFYSPCCETEHQLAA